MDTRGSEMGCLAHFAIGAYDGATLNDRYHGFGTITLTGQHEYAGMFRDGRRHGLGTMAWCDGLKYVGPWINNSATGQGSLSWPNGTEYFGDVEKGRRQGSGTLFHNDNVYTGEWHLGKRHGFGLQVSPDVSYSGEWVEGKRHGWGVATFASGNVYCGCWASDKMSGYGSMTWVTNKQLRTAEHVDCPPEISADGGPAAAAAANRDYIRQLRVQLSNVGSISPGPLGPYTPSCVERSDMYERYTGSFENNVPHGEGQYEMYFYDGSTRDIPFDTTNQYNGEFERGLRSGRGVQKYADGTMYDGQWSANMKHGKGTIIHPDGRCDEVQMELDAPRGNRPTTARSNLSDTADQNAAIEDTLELTDLFLTKRDRESLKELLTRFKSGLKHLFICYSKLWTPDDVAAKIERMLREDARVPMPQWTTRVDEDVRNAVSFGTPAQLRNTEMVSHMTRRAERLARDAGEKAMAVVATATELHAANAKQKGNDEDANDSDGDHDDFINITTDANRTNDTSAMKRLRKRPATPLNESGMVRSAATRLPAPPLAPSRSGKLSHISKHQFLSMLRDALILDAELTVTAVNDIMHQAQLRQALNNGTTATNNASSSSSLFHPADGASEVISFRAFVEYLVRIAEAKFTVTSTFAVPNTSRKWTLSDRLEFLLDHFLEPLRTSISETELSNELRPFDWPTYLADSSGDHTLEDLRRYAYRVVVREQARAATAAPTQPKVTVKVPGAIDLGSALVLDGPDAETVVAPPLTVEEFEASVSDRLTAPLCPNSGVEIVTIDVSSTKGTARSHQLYFLRQNSPTDGQLSSFFGGVVPSYHPAVTTVDVYDLLAALPTTFLHLSGTVRPAVDRHLRFLHRLFQECEVSAGARRANFGRLLNYLQLRGVFAPETSPHASDAGRPADGASGSPSTTQTPRDASHSTAAGRDPNTPPTMSEEMFVRVCWEMELGCFAPTRPEYCCPSLYLERRSLITAAIYDDPAFKSLLRVSPELLEAVTIAVRRTELWDERRRTFIDVPLATKGLDNPESWWWLVAHRIDFTFAQLVNAVLRLALSLYGTNDVVYALNACIDRISAPEVGPPMEHLVHCDMPAPSMVDELLPMRRSANPNTVNVVLDGKKKVPPKK